MSYLEHLLNGFGHGKVCISSGQGPLLCRSALYIFLDCISWQPRTGEGLLRSWHASFSSLLVSHQSWRRRIFPSSLGCVQVSFGCPTPGNKEKMAVFMEILCIAYGHCPRRRSLGPSCERGSAKSMLGHRTYWNKHWKDIRIYVSFLRFVEPCWTLNVVTCAICSSHVSSSDIASDSAQVLADSFLSPSDLAGCMYCMSGPQEIFLARELWFHVLQCFASVWEAYRVR